MTAPDRLLVHVGYHRTGTTWLQQAFFPQPSSGFLLPWDRAWVNEELVLPKPLVFDPERLGPRLEKGRARARQDGRIAVLSNERFSGNPHSGGYDSGILADRLHRLFPDARILMVIREQRDMIRSIYYRYVFEGGVERPEGYLQPPRAGRMRIPLFDFDFYAYHRLVAYYQQLFGRERVLVLPYELLRHDARAFVARIAAFAGAAPPGEPPAERRNPSLSSLAMAIKRPLNRWLVRDALNPAAPLSFERSNHLLLRGLGRLDRALPAGLQRVGTSRLRAVVARETAGRYAESNRRTAALTGLDLAAWGYEVEAPRCAATSER